MSYYQADYYRNPVPYTSSDIGEPVPGWGTTIRVAGPRRVGVGARMEMRAEERPAMQRVTGRPAAIRAPLLTLDTTGAAFPENGAAPPPCPEGQVLDPTTGGCIDEGISVIDKIPWWAWPIGAAVLMGGIGYYGVQQGWL
jgi:hypothetical protein